LHPNNRKLLKVEKAYLSEKIETGKHKRSQKPISSEDLDKARQRLTEVEEALAQKEPDHRNELMSLLAQGEAHATDEAERVIGEGEVQADRVIAAVLAGVREMLSVKKQRTEKEMKEKPTKEEIAEQLRITNVKLEKMEKEKGDVARSDNVIAQLEQGEAMQDLLRQAKKRKAQLEKKTNSTKFKKGHESTLKKVGKLEEALAKERDD